MTDGKPYTQEPRAQRWQLLVTEHRATLSEILRLAAQYPADLGLDACRCWANRILRELDHDVRRSAAIGIDGPIGMWGPNGKGPAILSQLHSARTFAELAARKQARAA